MNKQNAAEVFSRPNDRIRLHLNGTSQPFDARSAAIRVDLADVAASTHHLAPHYAAALAHICAASSAIVRNQPDASDSATTQILHGETFHVLDIRGDWAWGYCGHDHYVGYVLADALSRYDGQTSTHRVTAPAAPLFTAASIKSPVAITLPAGSLVAGTVEGDFLKVTGGYVHLRHVADVAPVNDWVAVARTYMHQPYLWGGRGDGGLDCSGLVQMALAACGIPVARDTDQQAGTIGRPLGDDEALAGGDIVFFPGHVGIMTDGATLIHANAYWMRVVEESLADVVARLAPLHAEPITARRRVAS